MSDHEYIHGRIHNKIHRYGIAGLTHQILTPVTDNERRIVSVLSANCGETARNDFFNFFYF